jgi:hypothetical protein
VLAQVPVGEDYYQTEILWSPIVYGTIFKAIDWTGNHETAEGDDNQGTLRVIHYPGPLLRHLTALDGRGR